MSFTTEERASFKTLQAVMDFARVDPAVSAAFYVATGANGETIPRALGIVPCAWGLEA